jgi:hypothetical protein
MVTWTSPTLLQLLTAFPLLLSCFLGGRLLVLRGHSRARSARTGRWYTFRQALRALGHLAFSYALGVALGILLIIYLDRVGVRLGLLTNESIDGLIILLLLASSAALLQPQVRTLHAASAWLLLWSSMGAVVLFAAEGALFPKFPDVWYSLGFTGPDPMPQALPALIVVVPLSYACWRISRVAAAYQQEPKVGAGPIVPAVPILLLLLAAETATLPHTFIPPRVAAACIVGLSGVVVAVGILQARGASNGQRRGRQRLTGDAIVVALLLGIAFLAYPLLVGFSGSIRINLISVTVQGFTAFLVAMLVHGVYAIGILCVVGFGLDRLAVWAAREARRSGKTLAQGLAEGLPLLLVFVTFFTFSQETWQVLHLASPSAFVALLVLLLLAVLLVVLWTALTLVETHPKLAPTRLGDLTADVAAGNPALKLLVDDWKEKTASGSADPKISLRGKRRGNAVAVLAVYEVLVLVPLTCLAAVLLYLICKLTIHPPVAAGWIYGDGQEARGEAWEGVLFPGPWVRVAIVLAVFALLYVVVEVHRDDTMGKRFFAGASIAMDQRLAVYVLYHSRLSTLQQTYGDASTTRPAAHRAPLGASLNSSSVGAGSSATAG